jgi:cell division protein ZapE
MIRIDGEDYRHRDPSFRFQAASEQELQKARSAGRVLETGLAGLLGFLGSIHQSRYAKVAEQFDVLVLLEVNQITDQFEGMRFVSFIDRCYEAGIALRFTGEDLATAFRADHVAGAYQKKYLRCLSRLSAMVQRETA